MYSIGCVDGVNVATFRLLRRDSRLPIVAKCILIQVQAKMQKNNVRIVFSLVHHVYSIPYMTI